MPTSVAPLYLPQPGLTDTEVVGYFVQNDSPHLSGNLPFITAVGLNGLLEDGYLVGEHHSVAATALRLRHPLVEPEQRVAPLQSTPGQLAARGVVLYHHVDVFQTGQELVGKAIDGLGYQFFETLSIHYLKYSPDGVSALCGSILTARTCSVKPVARQRLWQETRPRLL